MKFNYVIALALAVGVSMMACKDDKKEEQGPSNYVEHNGERSSIGTVTVINAGVNTTLFGDSSTVYLENGLAIVTQTGNAFTFGLSSLDTLQMQTGSYAFVDSAAAENIVDYNFCDDAEWTDATAGEVTEAVSGSINLNSLDTVSQAINVSFSFELEDGTKVSGNYQGSYEFLDFGF